MKRICLFGGAMTLAGLSAGAPGQSLEIRTDGNNDVFISIDIAADYENTDRQDVELYREGNYFGTQMLPVMLGLSDSFSSASLQVDNSGATLQCSASRVVAPNIFRSAAFGSAFTSFEIQPTSDLTVRFTASDTAEAEHEIEIRERSPNFEVLVDIRGERDMPAGSSFEFTFLAGRVYDMALDVYAEIFEDSEVSNASASITVTPLTGAPCSPADVDGNDGIDVFDLITFLQNFDPTATCPADAACAVADIDGNDAIDVFDLIAFLQAFDPSDPNCPGG